MMSKSLVLTPRSYRRVLNFVRKYGTKAAPRGLVTYELLNASMVLKNPRDRVIPDRARRMNIAFAVAEFYSFMFGEDRIDWFTQFIRDYDRFSSDGERLDGCYGTRVNFSIARNGIAGIPVNQVDGVIEKLRQDQDSRQAVIAIYQKEDLFGAGGKNTPCTLTLQFLLRDGRLNMIVNMRSSDIVKGVTYDIFVFTMVQEYVARQLGVELGTYFHNAGSLHLYETDLALLNKLGRGYRWPHLMNAMPRLDRRDLEAFRRLGDEGLADDQAFFKLANDRSLWSSEACRTYIVSLSAVMKSFINRHTNRDVALRAHDLVKDRTLKFVLRQALLRAGLEDKSRLLRFSRRPES